jgi:hypothetical protein
MLSAIFATKVIIFNDFSAGFGRKMSEEVADCPFWFGLSLINV